MNRHQYRTFRPSGRFPAKRDMPATKPIMDDDSIFSAVTNYLTSRGVSGLFRDLLLTTDLEQSTVNALALERSYSLIFFIENSFNMGLDMDKVVMVKRDLLAKASVSVQYRAIGKAILERSSCHVESMDRISCNGAHPRCQEYLREFIHLVGIETLERHSEIQPRCKHLHHDLLLKNAGHPDSTTLVGMWCPVMGVIDHDCLPYKT